MTKLRLAPEEKAGLQTRARFLKLARSLQSELPWISGVRESGPIDSEHDIDLIFYVTPTAGGKAIKIPFGIISSCQGKDYSSDELARSLIQAELTNKRDSGTDYGSLFAKEQPRPQPRYARDITRIRLVAFHKRLRQIKEFETKRQLRAIGC